MEKKKAIPNIKAYSNGGNQKVTGKIGQKKTGYL